GGLGSPRNDGMEAVWAFLLKVNDSLRYTIFFTDPTFLAERRRTLEEVRQQWHEFARERVATVPPSSEQALVPADEVPPTVDAMFQEFTNGRPSVLDLYADF